MAIVRTADIGRQVAAAVRSDDLDIRMAIQESAEDHMRQSHCRIQRHAYRVTERAGAGKSLPAVRKALGVNENDGAELFRPGPEWIESLGRDFLVANGRRHHDALQAELPHPIAQLLGGEIRML